MQPQQQALHKKPLHTPLPSPSNCDEKIDIESQACLLNMREQEKIRSNRIPGVRTVLVVLSAAGMVYDMEAMRHKVLLAYPDAAVFFFTTCGNPIGSTAPQYVDLLIDFTGPHQKQSFFFGQKLRRMTRVAIGRNTGFFRKRIYDRIYDKEWDGKRNKKRKNSNLHLEKLEQERAVQREVLALAGVASIQTGEALPDRGKNIALELPPLAHI